MAIDPAYQALASWIQSIEPQRLDRFFERELPSQLADIWCRAYALDCTDSEIVSVTLDTFSYLFDVRQQRNIAAYGIMGGRNRIARDHARMAGYPKAEGPAFHRGHMIPHSGGGGTDINLFIQRGDVNIGVFRSLERLAVGRPGSFYFVHLRYPPGLSVQRPSVVEQGLVLKASPAVLDLRVFPN